NLTCFLYFHRYGSMKGTRLPTVTSLEATEAHSVAFNALAHLTRLRIFFFLVRAGRDVQVREIQEALGIPGPTLSHHLDILRRASLVQSRREERRIFSVVNREIVSDLVRLLTACC